LRGADLSAALNSSAAFNTCALASDASACLTTGLPADASTGLAAALATNAGASLAAALSTDADAALAASLSSNANAALSAASISTAAFAAATSTVTLRKGQLRIQRSESYAAGGERISDATGETSPSPEFCRFLHCSALVLEARDATLQPRGGQ
jgi:hypothetical protein